jgi:hypothetical protein
MPQYTTDPGPRANLYLYALADPTDIADPTGLGPWCGSGLSNLAPDIIIGAFDFTAPCRRHDVCYGTCGANRSACDGEFYQNLKNACNRRGFAKWNCMRFAEAYCFDVDRFGQSAFASAQRAACVPPCKPGGRGAPAGPPPSPDFIRNPPPPGWGL